MSPLIRVTQLRASTFAFRLVPSTTLSQCQAPPITPWLILEMFSHGENGLPMKIPQALIALYPFSQKDLHGHSICIVQYVMSSINKSPFDNLDRKCGSSTIMCSLCAMNFAHYGSVRNPRPSSSSSSYAMERLLARPLFSLRIPSPTHISPRSL